MSINGVPRIADACRNLAGRNRPLLLGEQFNYLGIYFFGSLLLEFRHVPDKIWKYVIYKYFYEIIVLIFALTAHEFAH